MERKIGTVSRGIRCPIIRQGDDLVEIATTSVLDACKAHDFELYDRDVIALTESIVARAQGNYASIDAIAKDVKAKTGGEDVGVIFPILSRNRFAIVLKGIARGVKKVYLMLSYPSDEVGNALLTYDQLDEKNVNPYSDVLDLKKYRELFGENKHEFTGVDYVEYYQEIVRGEGAEVEVIFANQAKEILNYTKKVIACDIHTRKRTKRILLNNGAEVAIGLDDILTSSVDGNGYNEMYGLLGSNKSTEDTVKLFPRDSQALVENIQARILELTGKHVEVMVYGDGCFKDNVSGIWEFADPDVSTFYTEGLDGSPNEIKAKYFIDGKYADLKGEELDNAIKEEIKNKKTNLVGNMDSQGTTPRRYVSLLASLMDLTSGSGDRCTPVVLVKNYL